MPDTITSTNLSRWRADPATFIEEVLVNPDTGVLFELLPAERTFMRYMFMTDADGRLIYTDLIFSCPKKSGKTTLGAALTLTVVVLFGERHGEAICCANDQEQAQGRVFAMCRRIVEASPLLARDSKIISDKISFPAIGATITAIASDAASAAGGHQCIATFDEIWGFVQERARRLWDELVPVPTRKVSCRLVVSYAGFENESVLLKELHDRGMSQPLVAPNLHAGDGILCFWSHVPIAPWQDARWLAEMRRSLRGNQYLRMIENRWTASESAFISLESWDRCVDPAARPVLTDKALPIWVGIDASVKHDSTAIVAVTWSQKNQHVRLVAHKTFQPTPNEPIDFVAEVEQTILDWRDRFGLQQVFYDPYQMAASAQRLAREGIVLEEYPQHPANLTALAQNLFDLITDRNLSVYPNEATRLAISRAVAVESGRGWRITKEKQAHRIDFVIALGLAALAAVRAQDNFYDGNCIGFRDDVPANADYDGTKAWRRNRLRFTPTGSLDDGYAHAQWARLKMQETIDRISQPPQPPHDLLDLIRRCTPKERFTNADPK
jgi:phage terminase large subunit-like protein